MQIVVSYILKFDLKPSKIIVYTNKNKRINFCMFIDQHK